MFQQKYITHFSADCKDIGAVNTVLVNENTELAGYNTDKDGFLQSLTHNNIHVKDKRVLILGAGGSATSIVYGLLQQKAEIEIYNRTFAKAYLLQEKFSFLGSIRVQTKLNTNDIDLIINTTSLGMNNIGIPLKLDLIKSNHTVIDIVYTPLVTPLLKEAQLKNCTTLGGLDMLVQQGALAFSLFTGITPDKAVMKNVLLSHFAKN